MSPSANNTTTTTTTTTARGAPPPKGILKTPSTFTSIPPAPSASLPAAHAAAAALFTTESTFRKSAFQTITTLLTYPLHGRSEPSSYPASRPSPLDIAPFTELVSLLTPSEFDDLVEERSIEGQCGYALCPHPRRVLPPRSGLFAIHGSAIAKKADVEKWCSDACARRAMNVKLQLGDRLLRDREGRPVIELLVEDGGGGGGNEAAAKLKSKKNMPEPEPGLETTAQQLPDEVEGMREALEKKMVVEGRVRDLARERAGMGKVGSRGQKPLVREAIVEKVVKMPAVPPSLDQPLHQVQGTTEGYKSSFDPTITKAKSKVVPQDT